MNNQLIISNTLIPVDHYNRVNLNALHKASGVGKSKQPSNWLRLQSSLELINELESQNPNMGFEYDHHKNNQSSDLRTGENGRSSDMRNGLDTKASHLRILPVERILGGKTPGTFAHELLAISYAGWISPKFQLEVNRVFLHSKRNEPELATLPTLSELPILDFPEMRLSMFIPFRDMFDCGWRLRMNQLFTILRQCQRSNTPISVKDVTGLEQELRSLLHIVETQGQKLSSIQQFVNH